jgi:hypothetical protein
MRGVLKSLLGAGALSAAAFVLSMPKADTFSLQARILFAVAAGLICFVYFLGLKWWDATRPPEAEAPDERFEAADEASEPQ